MADKRSAILEGAGRVFGRLGYADTRVEDIIEDAKVSRATFYKFFSGKEEVFGAVEEAFNLSFVNAMGAAYTPDLSPGELAEVMIHAYLRWIASWKSLAKTMWLDPTRPDSAKMREQRTDAFKNFVELGSAMVHDSGMPPADPLLYRALVGAISEVGLALTELQRVTDDDINRAHRTVIHVIRATLTSTSTDD